LARGEHKRAAELFERALLLDPRALSVHASLANAYSALGDTAKAGAKRASGMAANYARQLRGCGS
jgi:Tfp pilus assembly protein PilF